MKPLGDFQAWLRIFSCLSYDNARAFLAGDMSFYDAKHKVAASDASDARTSSYIPRPPALRTLRAKVVWLETTLGLEKSRIEKCLAMLRETRPCCPRWDSPRMLPSMRPW